MALSGEDANRYSRQMRFEPLGEAGQACLLSARAAVVGCGAVGSAIADILTRAGVGSLRLVDGDVVELSNLPRQSLFDESDVARALPKAVAAAQKLRRVNSDARIEPVVTHVGARNIEHLIEDVDLVLDGTDNFATRFLLNDAAVKHGRPWIFGAALAAHGMMMVIRPGRTPCLRCVLGDAPPPGSVPTCEEAGVLASTVHTVAALESVEAVKLLAGRAEATERRLVDFDLWEGRFDYRGVDRLRGHGHCPACEQGRTDYLDAAEEISEAPVGREAVQIFPPAGAAPADLDDVAERLRGRRLDVVRNEWLIRIAADRGRTVTLFADGRAIVRGAGKPKAARELMARCLSG